MLSFSTFCSGCYSQYWIPADWFVCISFQFFFVVLVPLCVSPPYFSDITGSNKPARFGNVCSCKCRTFSEMFVWDFPAYTSFLFTWLCHKNQLLGNKAAMVSDTRLLSIALRNTAIYRIFTCVLLLSIYDIYAFQPENQISGYYRSLEYPMKPSAMFSGLEIYIITREEGV